MNALFGVFSQGIPGQDRLSLNQFYGRLDNREDLPMGPTDLGVTLAAYEKWGMNCPGRLLGDFAFAVWDEHRQILFLARDPLGVKPLYYYHSANRFYFASEITPLLDHPEIPKRPDDFTILNFLLGEFRDPEATFFEGIKQLPAGHYLVLGDKVPLKIKRYWDPVPKPLLRLKDEREYLDRFREIFLQSVEARLPRDVPCGIFLSGGLDSTQVAAAAATLRRGGKYTSAFQAVTLLLEGFPQDEWDAIENLKRVFQIPVETIRWNSMANLESSFELYLESGETPHPNGFMTIPMLLRPLQDKGCQVVLTGIGATELMTSSEFGYLQDHLLSFRNMKFLKEVRRFSEATGNHLRDSLEWIIFETLREITPFFVRSLLRRRKDRKLKWVAEAMRSKLPSFPKPKKQIYPRLSQDLGVRALTDCAFAYALNQMDQLTAGFGMEIRHPFLDLRLIDFYLSVPPDIKVKWGYRKMFVQRALQGVVPGPFRKNEDSRYYIADTDDEKMKKLETERLKSYLFSRCKARDAYIDQDEIKKIVTGLLHYQNKNWRLHLSFLWRLAQLQSFLQKFFPENQKVPGPFLSKKGPGTFCHA